jgi:hypothetical protein
MIAMQSCLHLLADCASATCTALSCSLPKQAYQRKDDAGRVWMRENVSVEMSSFL